MLVSAIMLILIVMCLIILYNTNGFIKVVSMYFIAISAIIIIGMIYLSKSYQTSMQSGIEYRIFYSLNRVKLPLSTIVRLFNFSIFLYMFAAVLYIRYLYRLKWTKTILLLIPCAYMYVASEPQIAQILYFNAAGNTVGGNYFWVQLMRANMTANKILLIAYMIIPTLCALWRLRRISIFVKRKDVLISGGCVAIINLFVYFALFANVFESIMFYNVNQAKLPVNPMFRVELLFPQALLWLTIVVLVGIIVIFRPFRVLEKAGGVKVFPWGKRHDKDMSMVLHTYKNAFLGVLQQFTLVQTYIEKGAYDRALNNAGIGKNIAAEYMEMLNKTLSLLGKPNVKFKQTDLLYCINKAMQRVSLPADGSIKLDFATDTVDISVYGDERHLTEMFVNLILNAAEALEKKKNPDARIQISVFREEDLVQISVRDNGTGVERGNRRRIFSPFFTTKSSMAGGVGLSYVLNVIRLHHGEIRVKSAMNEFTEFQIVLPVYQEKRRNEYV